MAQRLEAAQESSAAGPGARLVIAHFIAAACLKSPNTFLRETIIL
jgi:hypothetical protein